MTVTEQAADGKAQLGVIRAGDRLRLEIPSLERPNVITTKEVMVNDAGMITLPIVEDVKVAGLSEFDAADVVGEAYHRVEKLNKKSIHILRLRVRE